jgi:hypothetical protein
MEKYCLFHIEGGLGKHVAATAVAKCIKNNYQDRKLIVVASYPEIFLTLPFVDRVYRIGMTPYFYENYILNNDTLIFKHEPYFTTNHIYKRKHLIENWCELYNLAYNNETPELIFNLRHKQLAIRDWKRDKPIMVIQSNGGPLHEQQYGYSWTRDMPFSTVRELVNRYKNDYHIIQVCKNESNVVEGVEPLYKQLTNMELFSLLLVSQKRVLIDSSLQHAAAAIGLQSVVLWVGTSPNVFGYNIHKNVVSTLPEIKLPDSYLFDFSLNGITQECPFNNDMIFDNDIIFKTIES